MVLYLFLIALVIGSLGAALWPLSLVVGLIAPDIGAFQTLIRQARSLLAGAVFWGYGAMLVVGGVAILRERATRKRPNGVKKETTDPSHRKGESGRMSMVVAITAYNEGEAITEVVREFKAQANVIEVIVIDNNSRDDTAALAARAGARVVQETQQGYGYACMRGLTEGLATSADVIVLTEGDSTFDPKDLEKFQSYLPHADMVIGTRVVPGLVEDGSQLDFFFTWGNIFIAGLMRLRFWDWQFLGQSRLSDVGCTYRAIHRDALERIQPDLVVGGNHFSPHMMLVALHRGVSMVEIPVVFRRRVGVSKGASQSVRKGFKVGLDMVWHIIAYQPKTRNMPTRRDVELTKNR